MKLFIKIFLLKILFIINKFAYPQKYYKNEIKKNIKRYFNVY